jgi:TPR repeat protein
MKRILFIVSMLGVCHLHAQEDWKKVVYAPKNIDGQVDINDLETYTMTSFKEHIQEHYEKSIPYCIVRVKSTEHRRDGTMVEYSQYYDAQSFNQAIKLNRVLEKVGLGEIRTLGDIGGYFASPHDAKTKLKFEQKDVDYFFINNLADMQFTFLSSLDRMMELVSGILPNLLIADLLLTENENFLETNDKAQARRVGHLLMGQMYCEGYPVPKNYERAVMHLRRFLEPKISTGMKSKVQRMYIDIMGERMSPRMRRGKVEAKLALGEIYSKGDNKVKQDFDRALYYFSAAAEEKAFANLAMSAQLSLSEFYNEKGQYHDALEYLDMAIKLGSEGQKAPFFIRALFEKGKICYKMQKYNEAFDSFSRAIEANRALPAQERVAMIDESCRVFLSRLYYEGNGIGKDYAKVAQYMMPLKDMPGEIGYEAQLLLGLIYYEGGYGVEKNLDAARGYLTKAANQTAHADLAERAQKKLAELNSQQSKK